MTREAPDVGVDAYKNSDGTISLLFKRGKYVHWIFGKFSGLIAMALFCGYFVVMGGTMKLLADVAGRGAEEFLGVCAGIVYHFILKKIISIKVPYELRIKQGKSILLMNGNELDLSKTKSVYSKPPMIKAYTIVYVDYNREECILLDSLPKRTADELVETLLRPGVLYSN